MREEEIGRFSSRAQGPSGWVSRRGWDGSECRGWECVTPHRGRVRLCSSQRLRVRRGRVRPSGWKSEEQIKKKSKFWPPSV